MIISGLDCCSSLLTGLSVSILTLSTAFLHTVARVILSSVNQITGLPCLKSFSGSQCNQNKMQTLCQPIRPFMIWLLPSPCSLFPAIPAIFPFCSLVAPSPFSGPSHLVSPLPETLFQIFAFMTAFSAQITAWERPSLDTLAT